MIIDPYHWNACTITDIIRESSGAVSIRLATTTPYIYESGQHAVVRVTLGDGTKLIRQYSFASAPSSGELWLTVVQAPGGEVSSWFISEAKIGDTIEVSQPLSGPLRQLIGHKRVCMIAGGSGIVPLMSHLREQRLSADSSDITLIYSTRSATRCYETELKEGAAAKVTIAVTDNDPRFEAAQIRAYCQRCDIVMICGSRPFTIAMREICRDVVSDDKIFAEAFSL